MLEQKLGCGPIDPANITLLRLIQMKLYEDIKLKTIKAVCEQATKEYAAYQALDSIDNEMRAIEFEFEFTKDGSTIIITKLPELVNMFEELFLRISVLKNHPNIAAEMNRLTDIERIIKHVIELINEWAEF